MELYGANPDILGYKADIWCHVGTIKKTLEGKDLSLKTSKLDKNTRNFRHPCMIIQYSSKDKNGFENRERVQLIVWNGI